jgi:threonine synthase
VVEDGLRRGLDTITTASTGNAAVSTAFGAAAVGLRAVIFVPTRCGDAKVRAMLDAGADVFRVRGGYEAACRLSIGAAHRFGWINRNTGVNPLTVEAKKTVAFEIWEQLGRRPPDVVVSPVGDGTTLGALYKGFAELRRCGLIPRLPRLFGVQAESCQPLVRRWEGREIRPCDVRPDGTAADGIAVTTPAVGDLVLEAVQQSDGRLISVTETEIAAGVALLEQLAGIPAEPAGAVAAACLGTIVDRGYVDRTCTVVILATGSAEKANPFPVPSPGRLCATDADLDGLDALFTA